MNAQTKAGMPEIVEIKQINGKSYLFRACTACRRFDVPHDDPRKTCERCRDKSRKRYASVHEKTLARLKEPVEGLLPESSSTHSQSQSSGQSLKRKAEKTFGELEGEEQRRAPKTMKRSVNVVAKKAELEANVKTAPFMEYQRASLLYDAVKTVSSSNLLCNFAGCHSIVLCDNIDHSKRVQMVVRDLRKIVKIPFKYDVPLKRTVKSTKVRVKYSCTCGSSVRKTLFSLTNPSGRKSVASSGPDGKTTIRTSEKATATENVCGGSVIITVRSDDSHFLGIPGQQVVVEIIH